MAIKLREAGIDNFRVIEKQPELVWICEASEHLKSVNYITKKIFLYYCACIFALSL